MSFLGVDPDELRSVAQKSEEAAQKADATVIFLQALVIALKAASLWTGGASAAYAAYLEGTVIPWLKKISMALKLFAQVLNAHADAQDQASAGETVDFASLPQYVTPQLPASDTRSYPTIPEPAMAAEGSASAGLAPGGAGFAPGGAGLARGDLPGVGQAGAGDGLRPATYHNSFTSGREALGSETLRDVHLRDDAVFGGGAPVSGVERGTAFGAPTTSGTITGGVPGADSSSGLPADVAGSHSLAEGSAQVYEWSAGTPEAGVAADVLYAEAEGGVVGGAFSTEGMLGLGVAGAAAAGLARIKGSKTFGDPDGVNARLDGEAAVGARVSGRALAGAYEVDGQRAYGINIGGEGFAGGEANGAFTVGNDLVRVGVEGGVQAGAGVAGGLIAEYRDGHLSFGASAGASLGAGGNAGLVVDVDVNEIARQTVTAAGAGLEAVDAAVDAGRELAADGLEWLGDAVRSETADTSAAAGGCF